MYACLCRGLTDADVRRAGQAGALTPASLVPALGLDDAECCGRCAEDIDMFVTLAWEGVDLGEPEANPDYQFAVAAIA
jgi:bacterioferritin-associated ferredoxin